MFLGLFSIWQNIEPSLVHFNAFGHCFLFVNGQILNKKSSHLITLITHYLWMTLRYFGKRISILKYAF